MAEFAPTVHDADPNEAPNGVAPIPGIAVDAGSVDPSSTTVAGAVANAYASMAEMRGDTTHPAGDGSGVGDHINLPDKGY
jgi:hypothetical protein